MSEEAVETLRESARNLVQLNRRIHRDKESDERRPVANSSKAPESIDEIIRKLKTKTVITTAELRILKNGLLDDAKNIEMVLNSNGSLRGLVRELTGKEARKQYEAAGCLCNLGLGDDKAGATVAKAAGPYLIAAIGNLSTDLAVVCTWAIGNLAGSGPRACKLLAAQGALMKLCPITLTGTEELKEVAMYALLHFGYQMKDELSVTHLQTIVDTLFKMDYCLAASQLLFITSCHKDFDTNMIPECHFQKITSEFSRSLNNHLASYYHDSICQKDCNLLYMIRTLANISSIGNCKYLEEIIFLIFTSKSSSFGKIIECVKTLMLKDDVISHSMFWLLGNLYCSHNLDHTSFDELFNPFFYVQGFGIKQPV